MTEMIGWLRNKLLVTLPAPQISKLFSAWSLGALYFRRRRKVKCELHTDNKREDTENGMLSFMVEVWRFELQASSTRNWRATNCATPRY